MDKPRRRLIRWPKLKTSVDSAKDAHERPECPICLDPLGTAGPVQALACGHSFCRPCVGMHVATRRGDGLVPDCPMCKATISDRECFACCPDARRRPARWPFPGRSASSAPAAGGAEPAAHGAEPALADSDLRALGLQRCPRCRAAIEKNGGCNQMRCRCGHRFQWRAGPRCQQQQRQFTPLERSVRESRAPAFYAGVILSAPVAGALAATLVAVAGAVALVRGLRGRRLDNGRELLIWSLAPAWVRLKRRLLAACAVGGLVSLAIMWPAAYAVAAGCVGAVGAALFVWRLVSIRHRPRP